jgi:hypothetical protein
MTNSGQDPDPKKIADDLFKRLNAGLQPPPLPVYKRKVETPVPTNSTTSTEPTKPPVAITPRTPTKPVVREEVIEKPSGPKRYPGLLRIIFMAVVSVAGGIYFAWHSPFAEKKSVQEIAQMETSIAAYTPTELIEGCENENSFDKDSHITGTANNVSILGMRTGPKTEFAVWPIGTNEVCTNSESLGSTFTGAKVINEGDGNCIGFFEGFGRNPAKKFALIVRGGGLHVCTEKRKG